MLYCCWQGSHLYFIARCLGLPPLLPPNLPPPLLPDLPPPLLLPNLLPPLLLPNLLPPLLLPNLLPPLLPPRLLPNLLPPLLLPNLLPLLLAPPKPLPPAPPLLLPPLLLPPLPPPPNLLVPLPLLQLLPLEPPPLPALALLRPRPPNLREVLPASRAFTSCRLAPRTPLLEWRSARRSSALRRSVSGLGLRSRRVRVERVRAALAPLAMHICPRVKTIHPGHALPAGHASPMQKPHPWPHLMCSGRTWRSEDNPSSACPFCRASSMRSASTLSPLATRLVMRPAMEKGRK